MTKYLILTIAILTVGLFLSIKSCNNERLDRRRLSDNQRTLMSDIVFYRTKDSLSAASVERLSLSSREFERHCGELQKTAGNLNLKIKQLQSAARTATETKYIVNTSVRDSIIDGTPSPCVNYKDSHLTFSGCISGETFSGMIESRDTLVQIVHRIPRKFWFIKWGCRAIRQEVISRNPHSRIAYTEYIEIK